MMRARRHARDYERLVQHSEALITWAAITLMTRRLAQKGATPSWPRKPAIVLADCLLSPEESSQHDHASRSWWPYRGRRLRGGNDDFWGIR
jgi:hypothetical protein